MSCEGEYAKAKGGAGDLLTGGGRGALPLVSVFQGETVTQVGSLIAQVTQLSGTAGHLNQDGV